MCKREIWVVTCACVASFLGRNERTAPHRHRKSSSKVSQRYFRFILSNELVSTMSIIIFSSYNLQHITFIPNIP
jgi:hypothetical protein